MLPTPTTPSLTRSISLLPSPDECLPYGEPDREEHLMAVAERRQGVTIFRAAGAPDLMATDFMSAPQMSDDTRERLGGTLRAGSPSGAEVKVVARDAGGFSLV